MNIIRLTPWNWVNRDSRENTPATETEQHRLSPFGLHREIDRLFEHAFSNLPTEHNKSVMQGVFSPRIDIAASPQEYSVSAELPGVDEKDITLDLNDNTLILKAEKHQESTENNDKGYYRVERQYGSFERMLNLPDDANPEAIKASYKNGVLHITIPRREPIAPAARRIEIQ